MQPVLSGQPIQFSNRVVTARPTAVSPKLAIQTLRLGADRSVFRLSPSVNKRLTNFLYPVRSWMPYMMTPRELRPHARGAWMSHGAFLEATNRHFSNTIHQGIVSFIWQHVFEDYGWVKISEKNQFSKLFEALLIDKLGILHRMDPRVEPPKLKPINQRQTIYIIDDEFHPRLRRLMDEIHGEYRSYLTMNPETNKSFKLHVLNREIVADNIRPSLWQ